MFQSDNKKKIILKSHVLKILFYLYRKRIVGFYGLYGLTQFICQNQTFFFFRNFFFVFLFFCCKIYMKVFVVDLFKGYEVLCLLIHLRKKIPQMTSSCRTFLLPSLQKARVYLTCAISFPLISPFGKWGKNTRHNLQMG